MLKNATPLTQEQALAVARDCEHPALEDLLGEMGEDGLDDYDGRKLIVDGDLHIEGNLDLDDHDCLVLVVRGHLKVDGYFRDRSDDGPTMTVVYGDLGAKNVVTAGLLEVKGDMKVAEAIVGDYNHGGALVLGSLRTDLLMPVDIEYEVRGDLAANERIPFSTTELESAPQRLHPRYYAIGENGRARLFAGEAGDGFIDALARGESILA